MKTYKEILKSVKENIGKDTFVIQERNRLDYTGVGFGYNLKDAYPKTLKQAKKDIETPMFDAIVKAAR